eukprot:SAG31_NODE_138_length_22877_cov_29.540917_21_plen_104_part_00
MARDDQSPWLCSTFHVDAPRKTSGAAVSCVPAAASGDKARSAAAISATIVIRQPTSGVTTGINLAGDLSENARMAGCGVEAVIDKVSLDPISLPSHCAQLAPC